MAPWWRDAPGRTAGELRPAADEYREDVPDPDRRRDRAARALGLDPAGLPCEAAALGRFVGLSGGRSPLLASSWDATAIRSTPCSAPLSTGVIGVAGRMRLACGV
ncbi:hypothetical protein GCM10010277_83470 [Streptomyces longisporoflavus]|nr:hypothetical protein GCM10010277_83470 [Streptomyces longisporoflavus]